ncbi:Sensor domain-containing diguanylate cyclase OS=Lysinibacillus sphaericus OX=1421 GN=LS41612_17235 PE=4 SV=1 [Lysinibacillus sphaericus]
MQQLATLTEESLDSRSVEGLKSVRSWYFEAYYLKSALIRSLSFLQGQVSYFKDQSTTDPLTGVTNRRTMDATLSEWEKNQLMHSIILLDLDHFKSVNDTYGHAVGDKVLQYLAKKMKAVARENDICCRYGGEEFIILLPNTTVEEAAVVAENLRQQLANSNSPCGRPVTLSAGVAEYPKMASTTEALIEAADGALYLAKQAGRNQVKTAGEK